ncbi:hypothetical protein DQ384_38180 [Sphaerisporangium album]|uniref:Uncharacterized protein n=1 Tax=Sphaerisporangium album TaxID=509200 RepID=A0A367EPH9_9ACTN|nr:hypothetical protein [Sphaerisporangium album]RCG19110.1 hypothetical protein DQ384_38180 [Sphaerisporangium album]
MQQPTIGDMVHVLVDPAGNNGSDIAAGIVTRAWEPIKVNNRGERVDRLDPEDLKEEPGVRDAWLINARVQYDTNQSDWLTSLTLYADEDSARERFPDLPPAVPQRAFWPRRG